MKNRIFQFVWFNLIRPFIPRKTGEGARLLDYSERMTAQISASENFGKLDFAILGDSNAENLATYSDMVQLGKELGLGVNIGIGGMRADSWLEFFLTAAGKEIFQKLSSDKNTQIIWNIGGNHVLQNRMDILKISLKSLHDMFPGSYNCLIPPIHSGLISSLSGISQDEIKDRVLTCNWYIEEIWKEKAIDTYTPFVSPSPDGEAYFTVLQDAVHFSDMADRKFRIPIIINHVKYGVPFWKPANA